MPMLTLVDLGVLRDVSIEDGRVVATITPTYSGCPAMATMRDDLQRELLHAGFEDAEVRVSLTPAWTSDWITEAGQEGAPGRGHLPTRTGSPPRGPGGADPHAHPPRGHLRAVRFGQRPTVLRIRADRMQGHVPVPRLPRTVRPCEGDLMTDTIDRSAEAASPTGSAATGSSSRSAFYPLTVKSVDHLTEDSAAVTFDVPDEYTELFDFDAGQSLTLRRIIDGEEHRRTYSICAPVGTAPRIGVREVPEGLFSLWLVHEVRPGETIEVQPPSGSFRADPRSAASTCASPPVPASPRCCPSRRPC
jgi:metal-sulfur cluster biosynthetic enzyme